MGGEFSPAVSEAARATGLEYHRWMWMLNRSGDAWALDRHPEWFTVSRGGDSSLDTPPYVPYYRWVCPSRESVRDYLTGLVGQAATEPGVDGIHLDYIRHSDVILPRGLWSKYGLVQEREQPEFDFCYCRECRRQFRELAGRDPAYLDDPPGDEDWVRFRQDSVTQLVRRLAREVRRHGKTISAAVFATPALARRLVRQAWDEWPMDRVFPMLYHPFYDEELAWIGPAVAEGEAALAGTDVKLIAGLYLPALSGEELREAIRLALDAGATGWSLFDLGSLNGDHLPALRRAAERSAGASDG